MLQRWAILLLCIAGPLQQNLAMNQVVLGILENSQTMQNTETMAISRADNDLLEKTYQIVERISKVTSAPRSVCICLQN